jgi:nucleotide-binding universal stress UspA family protein
MEQPTNIFRHILVPTDGSEPATTAGKFAIRLAAEQGAHITFVYVVDTSVANELQDISGKTAQQVVQELERTGQRHLDYLARRATAAQLAVTQHVRRGTPYTEITELAGEQGVDLIVIAQVGHRGPLRILIGNVTERVIENAPCPVLVVK